MGVQSVSNANRPNICGRNSIVLQRYLRDKLATRMRVQGACACGWLMTLCPVGESGDHSAVLV